MSEQSVLVDFVARGENEDEWLMVLVEEGPWVGPIGPELRRIQSRLYGAIDAALDGQLASQFPESAGKKVVIQLDAYDLPKSDLVDFFERFSRGALQAPEYQAILRNNGYVRQLAFKLELSSTA